MGFSNKVMESGAILNALMIIGFLGVVWLMIYGNLSGNLGFTDETIAYTQETINLTTAGNTPSGASSRPTGASLSSVVMINSTGGESILSGNYSISGVIISNATPTYGGKDVNVSYTVTYASQGEVSSDGVINNLTGGANTYFAFFPTIMTIAAIVLLITILVGLLFIVISIFKKFSGNSGFSG